MMDDGDVRQINSCRQNLGRIERTNEEGLASILLTLKWHAKCAVRDTFCTLHHPASQQKQRLSVDPTSDLILPINTSIIVVKFELRPSFFITQRGPAVHLVF